MTSNVLSLGLWATFALVLLVVVAFALVGQRMIERVISLDQRYEHNELLGHVAGIAGVVSALLLAFIVFVAWTNYDRAREAVGHESELLGDIARDFHDAAPEGDHDAVMVLLQEYLRTVVECEWPDMKAGREFSKPSPLCGRTPQVLVGAKGWDELHRAYHLISALDAKPSTRKVAIRKALDRFDGLYEARRERLAYGRNGTLSGTVWAVALGGGALTIACCWLFGFKDRKLRVASIVLIATSLALVFFLIIALDYPFRGKDQIDIRPYCAIWEDIEGSEIEEAGATTAEKRPGTTASLQSARETLCKAYRRQRAYTD